MPLVMADDCDPYPVRKYTKQEMIRKLTKVHASEPGWVEMRSFRILSDFLNGSGQLGPEFISKRG